MKQIFVIVALICVVNSLSSIKANNGRLFSINKQDPSILSNQKQGISDVNFRQNQNTNNNNVGRRKRSAQMDRLPEQAMGQMSDMAQKVQMGVQGARMGAQMGIQLANKAAEQANTAANQMQSRMKRSIRYNFEKKIFPNQNIAGFSIRNKRDVLQNIGAAAMLAGMSAVGKLSDVYEKGISFDYAKNANLNVFGKEFGLDHSINLGGVKKTEENNDDFRRRKRSAPCNKRRSRTTTEPADTETRKKREVSESSENGPIWKSIEKMNDLVASFLSKMSETLTKIKNKIQEALSNKRQNGEDES